MLESKILQTLAAGLSLFFIGQVRADAPKDSGVLPPEVRKEAEAAIERGFAYLKNSQDAGGGWTPKYGAAITAIVGQAFVQDGKYGPRSPVVQKAVERVLATRQKDGGIYTPGMNLENYQTAVALSFLAGVRDEKTSAAIDAAQRFLTSLQYDDHEKIDPSNPWYGGAGYTSTKRPDLSNTQMMLEALHQSGLPASDPAYQKALKFISRCQNLAATNDQAFAKKGSNDGGFIYSPVSGGESKAAGVGELIKHDVPSYGSMTYSGFKSMLYAGVDKKDPRVKGAYDWICKNYTLEGNAGMPAGKSSLQGLYYNYHVFAKSLKAWGEPTVTDSKGTIHNWRIELIRKLISLQRDDGSWVNNADRWNEGDPNYVTALAILALQEALKP